MSKFPILPFLIAAGVLALPACEKTKEQFDFSKRAPDEFAVVRRAPLEIPQNLNSLPPPKPGAQRPQEMSPTDQARSVVLGETPAASPPPRNVESQGEALLLQKTGAANASPAIRATIDAETTAIAREQEPGINKIKRWIGQDVKEPAQVVDPVAEANRIKQNRAAGKPVTAGETPVKEVE